MLSFVHHVNMCLAKIPNNCNYPITFYLGKEHTPDVEMGYMYTQEGTLTIS